MAVRRKWWWVLAVLTALLILALFVVPNVLSSPKDAEMTACVTRLRKELQPLDPSRAHVATSDEAEYLAFYGLDVPGARHWLGTRDWAGHRVAVQVFEPEAAQSTVLIVHGYYDHAGVWQHVIRALVKADYRVVIYDQPGHGLTDGEPAGIDDFQTYVKVLDAAAELAAGSYPGDLHVVAHSMGAGVVADWLLQGNGEQVDRVVLLAPLFHSTAWGISRFGHAVFGRWFRSLPRKYRRNSGDAEFLAFVRADPLQCERLPSSWVTALGRWNRALAARSPCQRPLVVYQGDRDTTVDWKHNIPLLRRLFPKADVHMVEGGQHQLMNEAPELREQVIQDVLASLAAPAE
jgi:alpha-beta hydrolase superfamily lysophospholipase